MKKQLREQFSLNVGQLCQCILMPSVCFKTQSSWTKRAVEIDSPQQMSPDQPSDLPDSTCAQVIHPTSEICSNRWLPTANKRSGKKHKENNGTMLDTSMVI